MITQKQIIINLLREKNDWTPLWDLIKVNTKWGWLGTSARTRVQELTREGKIEHKFVGKYSYYKAKPVQYQIYFVRSPNGEIEKTIKIPYHLDKIK